MSLTEVSLARAEFDSYEVKDYLSLTFCLKELRVSCGSDLLNYVLMMLR